MGLIRDVLGSALGAGQVNNGFSSNRFSSSDVRMQNRPPGYPPPRYSYDGRHQQPRRQDDPVDMRHNNNNYYDSGPYYNSDYQSPQVNAQPPLPPRQRYTENNDYQDSGYSQSPDFRPLALPQITYGDGQPFLRGYSNELRQYGVSFRDFIQALDNINIAIIPNPEAQVFQKGANIAGWFLPGAASIGLTVGQIGVGLGTAMGHSSAVARALSKANLDLFVPNGLEICIGKSKDVDAEVGISSSASRSAPGTLPEDRVARYGNLIAPLSDVLPPLANSGRQDPLAAFGQRIGNKADDKKVRKAREKMEKGKTDKFDALEGGLQWVRFGANLSTVTTVAHYCFRL
ncbi:hypothetical protein BGW36DRAFT_295041 [Talaromyces proteolyticus]|uniref:Uncharacterized protein n=1 Tax=Talaromyces proteolyticus TaxID=1131652 RepID=A0AAD4Q1L8_9EURO|nr:uncharacterized protein BGW36DRAFT_295041 [Talaromyces proteolyticus]KAH8698683.1 hypothetical protein BGW36DRAFT_295041 [Talaromyces proteolyticus]